MPKLYSIEDRYDIGINAQIFRGWWSPVFAHHYNIYTRVVGQETLLPVAGDAPPRAVTSEHVARTTAAIGTHTSFAVGADSDLAVDTVVIPAGRRAGVAFSKVGQCQCGTATFCLGHSQVDQSTGQSQQDVDCLFHSRLRLLFKE